MGSQSTDGRLSSLVHLTLFRLILEDREDLDLLDYSSGGGNGGSGSSTPRQKIFTKRRPSRCPPVSSSSEYRVQSSTGGSSEAATGSKVGEDAGAGTEGASVSGTKRKDPLKHGLDALQRALPHVGSPEEEKLSQASVLAECAKYLKQSKKSNQKMMDEIAQLKEEIMNTNAQIEEFQSQLPENGALPLLNSSALTSRQLLPDMFHDHVIEMTQKDWRYWVFTAIMGHFVHSFSKQVSAGNFEHLQSSATEWVAYNLTLHNLRRDAYRKLAKISAKTSIVEDPSKLPAEAFGFVSCRNGPVLSAIRTSTYAQAPGTGSSSKKLLLPPPAQPPLSPNSS